ncbi:MAG: 2-amino-4-hydroxy-6-hydroxymethyldihydropteridine diphosphokinase [Myxococcales bacterium]|nr:2-amino-4-hydroxy-6-hydroxymethyldihydropteridine diphosphokinase [Myxococcales bacterium]
MGNRFHNIMQARQYWENNGAIWDLRHSELVESAPWGPIPQDPYINAVSVFSTSLTAEEVLAECLRIEQIMGRTRQVRFGPRVIDLDLLLGSVTVIDRDDLVLPHPRLHERGFVLQPLVAIWPDAWHVTAGCTVSELWTRWKHSVTHPEDFVWDPKARSGLFSQTRREKV